MADTVTLDITQNVGTAYVAAVLDDDPLLYWRAGETGGAQAADATGNGRTGTITGATLNQPGVLTDGDGSVLLDATTGRIKSDVPLMSLGTVTVELWVYIPTLPGANATIATFNDGDSTSSSDKVLYIQSDGKLRFFVFDQYSAADKTTSAPVSATVAANTWTHVVATVDGTTNRLYQNGAEIGSVAAQGAYSAHSDPRFSAGYLGNIAAATATTRLAARRDEIAVYDYALSGTRILQHYNAGAPVAVTHRQLALTGVG